MLEMGKLYRYNVDPVRPATIILDSDLRQGRRFSHLRDKNELLVPIKHESCSIKDGSKFCWIKILRSNGQLVWMHVKPDLFVEVIGHENQTFF